eukprot:gene587-1006_t
MYANQWETEMLRATCLRLENIETDVLECDERVKMAREQAEEFKEECKKEVSAIKAQSLEYKNRADMKVLRAHEERDIAKQYQDKFFNHNSELEERVEELKKTIADTEEDCKHKIESLQKSVDFHHQKNKSKSSEFEDIVATNLKLSEKLEKTLEAKETLRSKITNYKDLCKKAQRELAAEEKRAEAVYTVAKQEKADWGMRRIEMTRQIDKLTQERDMFKSERDFLRGKSATLTEKIQKPLTVKLKQLGDKIKRERSANSAASGTTEVVSKTDVARRSSVEYLNNFWVKRLDQDRKDPDANLKETVKTLTKAQENLQQTIRNLEKDLRKAKTEVVKSEASNAELQSENLKLKEKVSEHQTSEDAVKSLKELNHQLRERNMAAEEQFRQKCRVVQKYEQSIHPLVKSFGGNYDLDFSDLDDEAFNRFESFVANQMRLLENANATEKDLRDQIDILKNSCNPDTNLICNSNIPTNEKIQINADQNKNMVANLRTQLADNISLVTQLRAEIKKKESSVAFALNHASTKEQEVNRVLLEKEKMSQEFAALLDAAKSQSETESKRVAEIAENKCVRLQEKLDRLKKTVARGSVVTEEVELLKNRNSEKNKILGAVVCEHIIVCAVNRQIMNSLLGKIVATNIVQKSVSGSNFVTPEKSVSFNSIDCLAKSERDEQKKQVGYPSRDRAAAHKLLVAEIAKLKKSLGKRDHEVADYKKRLTLEADSCDKINREKDEISVKLMVLQSKFEAMNSKNKKLEQMQSQSSGFKSEAEFNEKISHLEDLVARANRQYALEADECDSLQRERDQLLVATSIMDKKFNTLTEESKILKSRVKELEELCDNRSPEQKIWDEHFPDAIHPPQFSSEAPPPLNDSEREEFRDRILILEKECEKLRLESYDLKTKNQRQSIENLPVEVGELQDRVRQSQEKMASMASMYEFETLQCDKLTRERDHLLIENDSLQAKIGALEKQTSSGSVEQKAEPLTPGALDPGTPGTPGSASFGGLSARRVVREFSELKTKIMNWENVYFCLAKEHRDLQHRAGQVVAPLSAKEYEDEVTRYQEEISDLKSRVRELEEYEDEVTERNTQQNFKRNSDGSYGPLTPLTPQMIDLKRMSSEFEYKMKRMEQKMDGEGADFSPSLKKPILKERNSAGASPKLNWGVTKTKLVPKVPQYHQDTFGSYMSSDFGSYNASDFQSMTPEPIVPMTSSSFSKFDTVPELLPSNHSKSDPNEGQNEESLVRDSQELDFEPPVLELTPRRESSSGSSTSDSSRNPWAQALVRSRIDGPTFRHSC